MKLVKVGAASLNQTPLDWENNKNNIIAAIKAAKENGVEILCLPELCITGYGCEDMFHSIDVYERSMQILREIANECKNITVSVGLPIFYKGAVYNSAALIVDGKIRGFYTKQHLAGDGIHYEPRWFKAWSKNISDFDFYVKEDEDYYVDHNIGDCIFTLGKGINSIKIGFEICEDAWVADRPGINLSENNVDIILNPSASHFAFGKHEIRKRFIIEGSRAFSTTYIYANLLGNEAGRVIYDGDAMIASNGKLLCENNRFSYNNFELIFTTIDINETKLARIKNASFKHASPLSNQELLEVKCSYYCFENKKDSAKHCSKKQSWEDSSNIRFEEFTRAVSLGLWDYMRKSRSNGFVVSLSGGADSAACALLSHTAFNFAINELGSPKVKEITGIDHNDAFSLTKNLLTCVYQGTDNSSEVTRSAAENVAKEINASYYEFNIDPIYKAYVNMFEKATNKSLSWKDDDIALQNIQARTRSPGIWLMANVKGALLLSTSNRSEAAVGYATMDGDTSGGLSPIAGIDKNFLREWLKWMENEGPIGIGKFSSLKFVNEQKPTAELRPSDKNQTDEDDLMPYSVLDMIEKAAIRDKKSPIEVFQTLKMNNVDGSPFVLCKWIIKFFTLWSRNQWKRERIAASFHLDDENLDPRSWCRFPILSGSFEQELKDLSDFILKEENQ